MPKKKSETTMRIPAIRQLPSGSFFTRIRIDGVDISITKPTKQEAINEYIALKRGIKDAKKEVASKGLFLTLSDAIDQYIESKSNTLSPSTIRGYEAIKRTRFLSSMDENIFALDGNDWQKICNAEASLCSGKTLKNAWGFVSSVIRTKTKIRHEVTLPAVVPNARPYLDFDQITIFTNAVRGEACEIPALMALCSLRRSEIMGMTWDDIDLKAEIMFVRGAAVQDKKNKLVYKDSNKNETSQRTVPILMQQLRDALEASKQETGNIVRCYPNIIYVQINRVCKKAGLPLVGVHGLRHSFASLSYHLGIDTKTAMAIGGWKDDRVMMDIYTHIANRHISDSVSELRMFFREDSIVSAPEEIIKQKDAEIEALKKALHEAQSQYDTITSIVSAALQKSAKE